MDREAQLLITITQAPLEAPQRTSAFQLGPAQRDRPSRWGGAGSTSAWLKQDPSRNGPRQSEFWREPDGQLRDMGSPMIQVPWSRGELLPVKEAIELTPYFEGRTAVRDTVRRAVRPGQLGKVSLDREAAERLAGRLVAVDLATSLSRVRLLRALRESTPVANHESSEQPAPEAA